MATQNKEFFSRTLALAVRDKENYFRGIGTAFIVATFGRAALAITAAHSLAEIRRMDRPWTLHAPSTPELFLPPEPTINLKNSKICFLFRNSAETTVECELGHAEFDTNSDLALCWIELPDHAPGEFRDLFRIDTRPDALRGGARVGAFGYSMFLYSPEPSQKLRLKIVLRVGTLKEVYLKHHSSVLPFRLETDIPIDPGMSGGPLFALDTGVVHGLLSRDMSIQSMTEGTGDVGACAPLTPIAGYKVPPNVSISTREAGLITPAVGEQLTIIDLIRNGVIQDVGAAHRHATVDNAGNWTYGNLSTESGPAMTLGIAAANRLRLIVRCRGCGGRAEIDATEQALRYGAETTISAWHARLECSNCGSRQKVLLIEAMSE